MLRGIQEQLSINRQGRSYSQPLARSIVDLVRNRVQLLLAVARQVCALGQVLANQANHVFIAAPFPQAVRVAKVHRHAGVLCQLLVQRHFSPLAVGERLTQGLCNANQLVCKRLQHIGCAGRVGVWQLDQHQQAAGSLHQSAHCAGVGLAFNQVPLPMPRKLSILDLRRAYVCCSPGAGKQSDLCAARLRVGRKCSCR